MVREVGGPEMMALHFVVFLLFFSCFISSFPGRQNERGSVVMAIEGGLF